MIPDMSNSGAAAGGAAAAGAAVAELKGLFEMARGMPLRVPVSRPVRRRTLRWAASMGMARAAARVMFARSSST